MNLFDKAKNNQDKGFRKCLFCKNNFKPDKRALKRGWGLYCSKKCAARWRNENKNNKTEQRTKKLNQLFNSKN